MRMEKLSRRPVAAILGGGVAGATTALHLASLTRDVEVDILVVEPRATLGRGLAYSTSDPAHRINVPASRMSIHADKPSHFIDWLATTAQVMSPGTATLEGELFPERQIFGGYVAAQLDPLIASGAVRHVRAHAVSAANVDDRFLIELSDETAFDADIVVLAMSHPQPSLPKELRGLAGSDRLIADPENAAAISAVGPAERVLIVGTGLTSADVIASLDRRGFWGEITAISRRGLRPRGHGDCSGRRSEADFVAATRPTAARLLRQIRAQIAADARAGRGWQGAIDRVRDQGSAIWSGLDRSERARVLRHLRPYWDVHRFRVSPQIEQVLDRQSARGKLDYIAGRLLGAREVDDGVIVDFRRRGQLDPVTERFDRVVVTTGPAHGDVLRTNPVLTGLYDEGLVSPEPLGLGLLVAETCRAVDHDGRCSDKIFVAGPLARGHVGELMGVPEVAAHARVVAETVVCALNSLNSDAEERAGRRSQRPASQMAK